MKPIIFSGVQPSGKLHLGNYLGAISQWVEMQEDYQCFFCIVDQHAITVKQDPEQLRNKILEVAKIYLASGLDPRKAVIFQQSAVPAHAELAWILNCTAARMADLNKMTQYKDKARNKEDNVSVGLFDYPVLMAADILLYQTDIVPVGDDQVQHVELCRDLGKRFNKDYGPIFKIPEVRIRKSGARIMGLDDPTKKMSKSAPSEYNYIALTDTPEQIRKKINRAVTDSRTDIVFDAKRPGLANLLTIYSLVSHKSIPDLEKQYQDAQGYGIFKKDLAEALIQFLGDFKKRYDAIGDMEVREILKAGALKAAHAAASTLNAVKDKIGFDISDTDKIVEKIEKELNSGQ
jgi:tryptophanyl-tRNA synthetase